MATDPQRPGFEEFAAQFGFDTSTKAPKTEAAPRNAGPQSFEQFASQFGFDTSLAPREDGSIISFEEFAAQYGFDVGPVPKRQAAVEDDDWEITKGVKRGFYHTGALLQGAGAAIGDVLGFEEFTQNRINDYLRLTEEAEKYKAAVGSIEEIDSPGKFISWAAGLIGEQIPIMSTIFLGGIAGRGLASGVSAVLNRMVARGALSGTAATNAARLIAERAPSWGLTTGVIGSASAIESGGIAGEQVDAGLPLEGGVALTGGLAAGSLEAFAPLAIMRYFGVGKHSALKFVDNLREQLTKQNIWGRMGALGGLGALTEGSTELAQEAIAVAARKYVDENYDELGEETASRFLNAAAGGLLFGLVFGGVGGIPRPRGAGPDLGGERPAADTPPTPPASTPPAAPTAEGPLPEQGAAAEATVEQVVGTAGRPGRDVELITDRPVSPVLKSVVSGLSSDAIILREPAAPQTQPRVAQALRDDLVSKNLLVSRQQLLTNTESYNEKTGALTEFAQQTLETIEADLSARAVELGVEAPTFPALPTKTNLAEATVVALTPGERRQLAKLEELENLEGLNARQYERLEALRAKALGEKPVARQQATAEAMAEIETEIRNQMVKKKRRGTASSELGQLLEEGPLYAGQRQAGALALSEQDFNDAIAPLRVADEGKVKLVRGPHELGRPVTEQRIAEADAHGFQVQGVYIPEQDTTYFFLDRIPTKERALAMYLHEIVTHHGLRTLPDPVRKRIIALIRQSKSAEMKKIAEMRGMKWDTKDDTSQNVLAEEVLAELAENNDFDLPLWKRVIATLRAWLRQYAKLTLSDNDMRFILYGLHRYLERGNPARRAEGSAVLTTMAFHPEVYFGVSPENLPQFTARIIKALPKKDFLSRAEIASLMAKKNAWNKTELAVVEDVMQNANLGERFLRTDFEQAIRDRLIPLRVDVRKAAEDTMNNHLIAYGMSNLLVTREYIAKHAEVSLIKLPEGIAVPPEMNHFHTSNYAAHIRSINGIFTKEPANFVGRLSSVTNPNTSFVVEVQSDVEQKMRGKPPAPDELQLMQGEEKQLRGWLNKAEWFGNQEILNPQETDLLPANLFAEARTYLKALPARYVDPFFYARLEEAERQGLLLGERLEAELLGSTINEAHERLTVRLNEIQVALNAEKFRGAAAKEWAQVGPTIFRNALDVDMRNKAARGFEYYAVADADTVTLIEGWLLATQGRLISLPQEQLYDLGILTQASEIDEITQDTHGAPLGHYHLREFHPTKVWRAIKTKFPGGIEGFLEKHNPGILGIYRRHRKLVQQYTSKYDAKQTIGPNGIGTFYAAKLDHPQVREPVQMLAGGQSAAAVRAHRLGATPDVVEAVEALSSVWKTRLYTKILTLVQMARKFKIPQLQQYVDRITQWAAAKMEIISQAEAVIEKWRSLGKKDAEGLTRAIFAITQKSDEEHRPLSAQEKLDIFKTHDLSPDARQVYQMLEQTFADMRVRMRRSLYYNRARKFFGEEPRAREFVTAWEAADEAAKRDMATGLEQEGRTAEEVDALFQALNEIEFEFRQLENRDYFPYKRFGKYTVKLRATRDGQTFAGRVWKENDVVAFYTFENPKEQTAFFDSEQLQLWKRTGEFEVSMGIMQEKELSLADMPFNFLSILEADQDLKLTDEQKRELRQISYRYAPGRGFIQHMISRKGITGMSLDAQRVFGTYMQSAANHIARSEFTQDMDADLKSLDALQDAFEVYSGDTRGLDILRNELRAHKDYIMNPGEEWASLRALGFVWYLGFNVKSALINFTQIPMVTYPYLAERFGAGRAFNMLLASMKDAMLAYDPKSMKKNLPPYLDQLIARGIREGFIDEALAVELAGVAQGPLLERVIPTNKLNRMASQTAYYAAIPFRMTEKITRRTAFIAAVKLARAEGASMEEAYIAGREAVRATLFEYAKWNRPTFMRGRKSVFFLFWTFMQHMAFTLFGGQGAKTAMGVWMMLLLAGGLQGLPFAENLMDIIDWGATRVKKGLGMKDPQTDLRLKLREMVASFSDNPDIWMHGLSRYYGLGPLHVLSMLGMPIPNVDVSGSVTMGRMLPGTQELLGPARTTEEKLGRTVMDISGPVFGIGYMLMKAMGDDNPDQWKRWERAMPSALKSVNRAWRFAVRGKEEFKGGGTALTFDPYNTEHNVELIAQAFSFTPTRLNQRYELRAHQEERKAFIMTWRQRLLTEFEYVKRIRDREGVADLRKAIREFNRSVPDPRLRITEKVLARSLEERKRRQKSRELGVPLEGGFRREFREIGEVFPEVTPGQ